MEQASRRSRAAPDVARVRRPGASLADPAWRAPTLTSLRIRPVREADLDAIFGLALATGGGFTNLPPDRRSLNARIAASVAALDKFVVQPGAEYYMLVLEDVSTGKILGTNALFGGIGLDWPFYSLRLSSLTHRSVALDRSVRIQTLELTSEFDGASEVGGLFLCQQARGLGVGRLLAGSRYLFIAAHRERFGERVIAELRGYWDREGQSPFWNAVGRHFFDLDYLEADRFGAVHGNQFIVDLMPRGPIYVPLLPLDAQRAIGRPHVDGEAALAMLKAQGFRYDGYVDIFDAGPTVSCATSDIAAVRHAATRQIRLSADVEGALYLVAAGRGASFRAVQTAASIDGDMILLPDAASRTLGVDAGEGVVCTPL